MSAVAGACEIEDDDGECDDNATDTCARCGAFTCDDHRDRAGLCPECVENPGAMRPVRPL